MLTPTDLQAVSPALAKYTQGAIFGDLWKRPDLSPRDRSVVTVAALIARNQGIELPYYFTFALDNDVKPADLSEIITHLAFYCGWPNALSAVKVCTTLFAERGIKLLPGGRSLRRTTQA